MITTAFLRTMTSYNVAMNESLFAAASRLSDSERRADRGAFWRSIHGTFSHLVWADRMWMSRFAGWDAPDEVLARSGDCFTTFDEMAAVRVEVDRRLKAWAETLQETALDGELVWSSGAIGKRVGAPRSLLMMHLFNHQTHHRGQVHAMLTAAGETSVATDLPFVTPGSGFRFLE